MTKEWWRQYFNELFNEECIKGLKMRDDTLLRGHTFDCRIREAEVKKALVRMKIEKATGLCVWFANDEET